MVFKKTVLIIFFLLLSVSVFPKDNDYYTLKERIESEENFLKGVYHYNNMEYLTSIDFFRKSLEYIPANDRARYWLGKAYLMAGYKEFTIKEWEKIVRFDQADILLKQKLKELYTESFLENKIPVSSNTLFVFLKYLYAFPGITGIETDSDNNIYLSSFLKNLIEIRSPNFLAEQSVSVSKPMDIAIEKDWLAVSSFGDDSVYVYDRKSLKKIESIGEFGIKEGQFSGPEGLCFSKNLLYVSDSGNNRIQVFRLGGAKPELYMVFGKKGKEAGNFNRPVDIAYYQDKLYVLDFGNQRIQIFDLSGNYLDQITGTLLEEPRKVIVKNNFFYVVDQKNGLLKYDFETSQFQIVKKSEQDFQKPAAANFDNNGVLYIADFFTNRVTAYVPDKMKISSLKVDSLLTLNTGYPSIAVKLRVQDMNGNDMPGLSSVNFKVFQEGEKIPDINLFPLKPDNNKISVVILNQTDMSMIKYKKEVLEYTKKILDNLKFEDRIAVIDFGSAFKTVQPFTNQRLSILSSLEEAKYTENKESSFDSALYDAITKNLNNEYYNAILIFQDGKLKNTFMKYSSEVLANYAKNNGIPVFIVSFDEGEVTPLLKTLSKESGGEYLNFFQSNQIYSIFELIRKKQPLFYLLTYKSPFYNPVINKTHWLDIFIEFTYKSLYGADKTGYYIP